MDARVAMSDAEEKDLGKSLSMNHILPCFYSEELRLAYTHLPPSIKSLLKPCEIEEAVDWPKVP